MIPRRKKSRFATSVFFDMPARDEVAVRAARALDAEINATNPEKSIWRKIDELEKRVKTLEAEVWF